MKKYISWIVLGISIIANGYLAYDIVHTNIELSYYEGIRNVNMFEDCFHYKPYAVDLIRLRNTNIQNCGDISLLVNHKQNKVEPGDWNEAVNAPDNLAISDKPGEEK